MRIKLVLIAVGLTIAGTGAVLVFSDENKINVAAIAPVISDESKKAAPDPNADIGLQEPLAQPPKTIKAIYATGWSAGSQKKMASLINLIDTTELNAIVIDIKDYSGTVSYKTDIPDVQKYGATEVKILKPNALIKELHDKGIYAIARITLFQDPVLGKARPDLALTSSSTKTTWKDAKGLIWMDPASQAVWDYNIAIARDALARGFDEVNFDYIRFPTDGKVSDIVYPFWDHKTPKHKTIQTFFQYMRDALAGKRISADLFGLVTVAQDDSGIGQYLEDILPYVDYIAPMVYPSHFYPGSFNIQNPAAHPYEIIINSMQSAIERLRIAQATTTIQLAQFRPWFQSFNLGADYTPEMVRAQITAWDTVASATPQFSSGWFLWNPSNTYQREALLPE